MPLALAMTLTLTASNVQGAWITFFCAFFPGFGIKFLVGTLLDGLYESSRSTQDISSGLYLGVYAIARLCAGLSVGPSLPPKLLFLFALSVQSVLVRPAGFKSALQIYTMRRSPLPSMARSRPASSSPPPPLSTGRLEGTPGSSTSSSY